MAKSSARSGSEVEGSFFCSPSWIIPRVMVQVNICLSRLRAISRSERSTRSSSQDTT